jgi:hypothetical protein
MPADVIVPTPRGRLRGAGDGHALRFLGWERHAAARWPVMVFAEPSAVREDPPKTERTAWA